MLRTFKPQTYTVNTSNDVSLVLLQGLELGLGRPGLYQRFDFGWWCCGYSAQDRHLDHVSIAVVCLHGCEVSWCRSNLSLPSPWVCGQSHELGMKV